LLEIGLAVWLTFLRQRTALRSLVDDWGELGADQRKRLVSSVSRRSWLARRGISELVPHEGWRPYLKTALGQPRVLAERKTGLSVRDVETTRLVRDDRGWLRLAR